MFIINIIDGCGHMLGNITLEQYRIFLTVVEEKNMSKAAQKLHIGQPAVSMAISKMEEYFKVPLFTRSKSGTFVTPEGEILYNNVVEAFFHIRHGEEALEKMNLLERGNLRIGASDTLSAGYLLPFLQQYHQTYPNIHLQVTNRTTQETLSLLTQGAVDIGFINLPIAEDPRFHITSCLSIQDTLIGSSAFLEAKKGLLLEQLKDYPLLLLEPISSTRRYLDAYAAVHKQILSPAVELGSSDLLVAFAKIDLGLAFVIKEFVSSHLNEHLFEIPLFPPIPSRAIGLVRLKNKPLSMAGQAFVSFIENSIYPQSSAAL